MALIETVILSYGLLLRKLLFELSTALLQLVLNLL